MNDDDEVDNKQFTSHNNDAAAWFLLCSVCGYVPRCIDTALNVCIDLFFSDIVTQKSCWASRVVSHAHARIH